MVTMQTLDTLCLGAFPFPLLRVTWLGYLNYLALVPQLPFDSRRAYSTYRLIIAEY